MYIFCVSTTLSDSQGTKVKLSQSLGLEQEENKSVLINDTWQHTWKIDSFI